MDNQEIVHNPFIPNVIAKAEYFPNYLILMYLLMFLFFISGCYYYYNTTKLYQETFESPALHSKYQMEWFLTIGCFIRCASIIPLIIFLNKKSDDITGFILYLDHLVPTLIFISIFFSYIDFLIKKYYELKSKKPNVVLVPSVNFLVFVIYIVILVILIFCATVKEIEMAYNISNAIVTFLCFLLGILFFYFCFKISDVLKESTPDDKKQVSYKISFIGLAIGIIYFLKGIFGFCQLFNLWNFAQINKNIDDFIWFFFAEFICSLCIGTYKKEKVSIDLVNEIDKFDFKPDLNENNLANNNLNMNDINNADKLFPGLNDELLDHFENEDNALLDKKNSDKYNFNSEGILQV